MNNDFNNGFFWFNQYQTNYALSKSNRALAEANRLLEQIRRQLLSPAERAAEDAARAKAHAKKVRNGRVAAALIAILIGFAFLSMKPSTPAFPALHTEWNTPGDAIAPAPQSTPADYAPRAQLVRP
jgi:hypothetical protein